MAPMKNEHAKDKEDKDDATPGDPGDFYMKVIAKKFRGVWHYGVITGVVTEWVLEDYGGADPVARCFRGRWTLWAFCVQRQVTVQSGWVHGGTCLHHMETFSFLTPVRCIRGGPGEVRVPIRTEKRASAPSLGVCLGHMYKRMQGAAWFVTRWGLQNVVTEEDGPERKAQVDALTREGRTRYPSGGAKARAPGQRGAKARRARAARAPRRGGRGSAAPRRGGRGSAAPRQRIQRNRRKGMHYKLWTAAAENYAVMPQQPQHWLLDTSDLAGGGGLRDAGPHD
eukprot:jgi/Tetstr1/445782/TSEL_033429.t1